MDKREFATVAFEATRMEAKVNYAVDKATETIATAISLLATLNPSQAINVIEQLEEQKESIQKLIDEQSEYREKCIQEYLDKTPETIVIE